MYVPLGQWTKVRCYVSEVNVGLSISNLEAYSFESGAKISAEIPAGFKVKGIEASSTVGTSFDTSISTFLETEQTLSINIKQTYPGSKSYLCQWDMTMENVDKPDLPAVKWELGE